MESAIRLIFRIIVFVPVSVIIVVSSARLCLIAMYSWLRYGGELDVYDSIVNPMTIRRVYDKITGADDKYKQ